MSAFIKNPKYGKFLSSLNTEEMKQWVSFDLIDRENQFCTWLEKEGTK